MEERLKIYLQVMDEEVKPEDVKCCPKLFFKSYASFYMVTASDSVKARCSCRSIIKIWYVSMRC